MPSAKAPKRPCTCSRAARDSCVLVADLRLVVLMNDHGTAPLNGIPVVGRCNLRLADRIRVVRTGLEIVVGSVELVLS